MKAAPTDEKGRLLSELPAIKREAATLYQRIQSEGVVTDVPWNRRDAMYLIGCGLVVGSGPNAQELRAWDAEVPA